MEWDRMRENNTNTRQYKSIFMTLNLQKPSSHKRPQRNKSFLQAFSLQSEPTWTNCEINIQPEMLQLPDTLLHHWETGAQTCICSSLKVETVAVKTVSAFSLTNENTDGKTIWVMKNDIYKTEEQVLWDENHTRRVIWTDERSCRRTCVEKQRPG